MKVNGLICWQFGALTPLEPRLGKKLIEPLTNLIHRYVIISQVKKYSKSDIAVCNDNYHTATGNYMQYVITQCYLSPGRGDYPTFTPAEAGTWFSDPEGMQGWVDLGGVYIPR